MKHFSITIDGTAPFIMHNSRLADKLDPITRQKAVVAAKRKKTDEDDLEISRLEWLGGLYWMTRSARICRATTCSRRSWRRPASRSRVSR